MTYRSPQQPEDDEERALLDRWPDEDLAHSFHRLSAVYCRLLKRGTRAGPPDAAGSFKIVCTAIGEAILSGTTTWPGSTLTDGEDRRQISEVALAITRRADGVQRMASLLAMLMHLAVDQRTTELLVNRRRPRTAFPTYPTSPALAKLVGRSVLKRLLREPVPRACGSIQDAHHYSQRAYDFQIVDPSMESGQLLLGIAEAALEQIHRRHSEDSTAGRLLVRATLERLCESALWGLDRNAMAVTAGRLLVTILGHNHGVENLVPARLMQGDALKLLTEGGLPDFDGLVNNPPWGVAMGARERKRLRKQFKSVEHRPDFYIPFTEMALGALRPAGSLVLILPSQALAARNTERLRTLLAEKMGLERIVLLPHAAFSSATVRGVVLVGRLGPMTGPKSCRVTAFPLVKRFDESLKARSFDLPRSHFEERGGRSWWPLISGGAFIKRFSETLPLGDLARVALGVQVHHVGRGHPPQTRELVRRRQYLLDHQTDGASPAIRGREVLPFRVLDPRRFVKLGKWLSWVGDHEKLRHESRIFVRELCRRDGQLSAAAATDGHVPLHGVLTVIPQLIDLRILLGVLNSSSSADYVKSHTASFSKVDFQKITLGEMRQFPVPIPALDTEQRQALGLAPPTAEEGALRNELIEVVRECERRAAEARRRGSTAFPRRLDEIVGTMYRWRPRLVQTR